MTTAAPAELDRRYGRSRAPQDHRLGTLLAGGVVGVAAMVVLVIVAAAVMCGIDAVRYGPSSLGGFGLLSVLAVFALFFGYAALLIVGLPCAYLLNRVLRGVRSEGVHVLVFALVGLALGLWLMPSVMFGANLGTGQHRELGWLRTFVLSGIPTMLVAGVGRYAAAVIERRRSRRERETR